jgi:peptide deformylase
MLSLTLLIVSAASYRIAVPPLPRGYARCNAPACFEEVEEHDPGEIAGLRVLKYPHPSLRAENSNVEEFGDNLKQLTRKMFKMMYASEGVGLAAPQVGINQRLMVVNWQGDPGRSNLEVVLCNPQIVKMSSETEVDVEGCLSFPGFTADVERSTNIVVEFTSVEGKPKSLELDGWEARVFQHEYDHLDGKLYATDRLDAKERVRVQPALDRLVDRYDSTGGVPPKAL